MKASTPPVFAFESAGEQALDFAHEQLEKFRPGGKNYERLRSLQAAGAALMATPDLYSEAPAMLEAMTEACRIMNGDRTAPLARILEARAVLVAAIAKAKGQA